MWPAVPLAPSTLHRLSQVLCWLVLIGLASFVVWWVSILVIIGAMAFGRTLPLEVRDVMVLAWPALLYFAAGLFLYAWRTCDVCRFHLYNCFDTRWWPQDVARSNEAVRTPHAAAERVFNSFSYGAIWSKARRGVAHCAWCGHADRDRTFE
jgi:hypothetical protein